MNNFNNVFETNKRCMVEFVKDLVNYGLFRYQRFFTSCIIRTLNKIELSKRGQEKGVNDTIEGVKYTKDCVKYTKLHHRA